MPTPREFLDQFFPAFSHPPGSVLELASETNGLYRADVFLIGEEPAAFPYTVFSQLRDETYAPILVTELPHIPFVESQRGSAQMDDSIGLFLQIEPIHEPRAERARFVQDGILREAAIAHGHVVLFNWKSRWLALDKQAHISELWVDDRWEAAISPTLTCTPRTFASAWSDYQRGDSRFEWAPDALVAVSFRETLTLLRSLLLDLDQEDPVFKVFAEGPLRETLDSAMGRDLREFIATDADLRARWERALKFCPRDFAPTLGR